MNENFENRNPVTYDYLADAVQYYFGVSVKTDTLRHICRTFPGVKSIWGSPMETERVEAKIEDIDDFYHELSAYLEDIPSSFVFIVDETGCQAWSDSHDCRVLVPESFSGNTIKIPVDRNSKRSTLVGCIAADGASLRPLIIVDRKTMEEDLHLYGYSEEKCIIVSQKNAFMTSSLFEYWAETIFFPWVEERRRVLGYQGPALLLIDGLGAHHTESFIEEASNRNITCLFFVPHTSDQCQPLDLVTFSLHKRFFSQMRFEHMKTAQSNKVIKILGSWFQATAPHHNVSAFMAMGLMPYRTQEGIFLKVDRTKATKVRDYLHPQPPLISFGTDGESRSRLQVF
jgi:hypothetical protein